LWKIGGGEWKIEIRWSYLKIKLGNKRIIDKFALKDYWRTEREWWSICGGRVDGRVVGVGLRGGIVGRWRRSGNVCWLDVVGEILEEERWSEEVQKWVEESTWVGRPSWRQQSQSLNVSGNHQIITFHWRICKGWVTLVKHFPYSLSTRSSISSSWPLLPYWRFLL